MSADQSRCVTRVTSHPPHALQITFNRDQQTRSWEPADAPEAGSPQDVPAGIAEAITADPSLAPHFRVEPSAPLAAETPASDDRDDHEA